MVTRRKTRKAVTATVEGLHASFHRLDEKVRTMITKGCTDSQLVSCIRKEWSGLFHTDLSTPAVRGLVMHYRAIHRGKKKTRKQRGGMAPLNWNMAQGTTDPVYGRFPVEIGTSPQAIRGLDLGRFFESNVGRTCNATGGHPAPGSGSRQTQEGGSFFDAAAQGHFPATVPRNILESVGSSLQGAPIVNPPADPVSATTHLSTYTPQPYDARALMQIDTMAPVYRS